MRKIRIPSCFKIIVTTFALLLLTTLSSVGYAQTNATAQDLLSAVERAATHAFNRHFEQDEKAEWLREMTSSVTALRRFDHLPNQVDAVIKVKDALFHPHFEEDERQAWVREMVESIVRSPVCDEGIPNKIDAIIGSMKRNYSWSEEEEGREWARGEIAKLL